MAKTKKCDKHEGLAIVVICRIRMVFQDHTRPVFRKKLILQLQNKLTEFTVLHYNCDHSPCDEHGAVIVAPTY
jgi:hypothetical protein